MSFKTQQEEFWAGEFGEEYMRRNQGAELLASNLNFFSRALRQAGRIDSCLEFGASIGMNLRALRLLFPAAALRGIEINEHAAGELAAVVGTENVFHGSIFDYTVSEPVDLALIKGVLIHISPDQLPLTYRKLCDATRKWLLVCEYYSPAPVTIPYRGHSDRLFKRDFAGELLEAHPDLRLVDYGFAYRRDPVFPQDDITWFLLAKS